MYCHSLVTMPKDEHDIGGQKYILYGTVIPSMSVFRWRLKNGADHTAVARRGLLQYLGHHVDIQYWHCIDCAVRQLAVLLSRCSQEIPYHNLPAWSGTVQLAHMSCRRDGIAIDLVLTDIVHGPVHRPISSVSQTFFYVGWVYYHLLTDENASSFDRKAPRIFFCVSLGCLEILFYHLNLKLKEMKFN